MLREINIKNVAVIEKTGIEFGGGLNVLTGETGAGKSIIIDSINMILGERTSREFVRYGTDKAMVQAVFDASDEIIKACEEIGAECDDDTVIITREITSEGKSTARVNGMIVPLSSIKEISSMLVNIHGQHDNQALLTPSCHVNFLDEYAQNGLLLKEYREKYAELKSLNNEFDYLSQNEKEKTERIDLLRYQIDEIESAELEPGEEEELTAKRDEIANAEEISECVQKAYSLLYDSDGGYSAYDILSEAISALEKAAGYSETVQEAYSSLTDANYAIQDAAHTVKNYSDGIEFDKEALDEAEERLDLINKLKRKYGGDVESVIAYCEKASAELSELENSDARLSELSELIKKADTALRKTGKKLSEIRRKSAKELEEKITDALHELNMEHAVFSVEILDCEPVSNGMNNIQFLIRTNSGEPLKPLTKIASGGELSRTMLALKSILSDSVETLIFDEIDTGVSGSAAKKIAIKLNEISRCKQVLCITHLPQLASMADHHYLIEKISGEDSAKTTVTELGREERILELVRITGGDITETSKKHAEELIESNEKYKESAK